MERKSTASGAVPEPSPASSDAAIDAVLVEYFRAIEEGSSPDVERLLESHPEVRAHFARFLADEQRFVDRLHALPDGLRRLTPPPPARIVGQTLGDYAFVEEIGRGGMGVVYRAYQLSLKRTVAVKVLLDFELATPEDLHRFHMEAEAAAALEHPNILSTIEVGRFGSLPYFSMRFLERGSLVRRIDELRGKYDAAAELVEKIARAVHFAHQRGILHRDLKPGNILFDAADEVYVSDFGLAKRIDGDASGSAHGSIVGTAAYMSPEQARGDRKAMSTASDVYSLGVILYEILDGAPPFLGDDPMQTIHDILQREPKPLIQRHSRLPRPLATICHKCLEKEPERRYPSCEALANDLARFRRRQTIVARPAAPLERIVKWSQRRPAAAALVAVSVTLVLTLVVVLALATRSLNESARHATRRLEERDVLGRSYAYAAHARDALEAWEENRPSYAYRLLRLAEPSPGSSDQRSFEWYWLFRLLHQEELLLRAEATGGGPALAGPPPCDVVFSPTENVLAVANAAAMVRLIDLRGGVRASLTTPGGAVHKLAFSPDGNSLAATDGRRTWVWDAGSGILRWAGRDGDATVLDLAFAAGGRTLALAHHGRGLSLYDAVDGAPIAESRFLARSVVCSPDGLRIAATRTSSAAGARVCIFGGLSLDDPLELGGTADVMRCAVFVAATGILATAGEDGVLRTWRTNSGSKYFAIPDPGAAVASLAVSPNGSLLAAGTTDGRVRLWNVSNPGRPARLRFIKGHLGTVTRVSFSEDSRHLATASADGTVRVWALDRPDKPIRFPAAGRRVWEVAVGRDGETLFTGDDDLAVRVWRPGEGQTVVEACTLACEDPPRYVAGCLTRDGSHAAASTTESTVEVWRLDQVGDRVERTKVAVLTGHAARVEGLKFAPGALRLLTSGADGEARLWRRGPPSASDSWRLEDTFHLPFSARDFAFSDDLRLAAAATADDPRIVVREVGPPARSTTISTSAAGITALAFSRDSRLIAAGLTGGLVHLWSLRAALGGIDIEPWGVVEWHNGAVTALLFAPDGKVLFSGGDDGIIKIWHLLASPEGGVGIERMALKGFTGAVKALAISADGRTLVAGGARPTGEAEVRLWQAASDAEVHARR